VIPELVTLVGCDGKVGIVVGVDELEPPALLAVTTIA
jgi:hypothetical protein